MWCSSFVFWIRALTNFTVHPGTWLGRCKLYGFTFFLCMTLSSAMLVVMCAEKCFALYFPIRAKRFCKVKIAKRVTVVILLLEIMLNSHWFFHYKPMKNKWGLPQCKIVNTNERVIDFMYLCLYSIVPIILLTACSLAIIVKICCSNPETGKHFGRMAKQGTMMLLSIICFFMISTIPMTLYSSLDLFKENRTFFVTSLILSCSNHSVNALLYMLSGSKYREGVKKMFRRRNNKVDIAVVAPPAGSRLHPNICTRR